MSVTISDSWGLRRRKIAQILYENMLKNSYLLPQDGSFLWVSGRYLEILIFGKKRRWNYEQYFITSICDEKSPFLRGSEDSKEELMFCIKSDLAKETIDKIIIFAEKVAEETKIDVKVVMT